MKHLLKISLKRMALITLLFTASACSLLAQTDPLPSWNEGKTKSAILDYIKKVTDSTGTSYIPAADRIATFDNDGTLWAEKPLIEGLFMFFRAKQMIADKPALKNVQPYKSIAAGDMSFLKTATEQDLIRLFISTHSNLTAAEFRKDADDFFNIAKSPSGVPVANLVYKPQVELLQLLRSNGFKTYICTGGDIDFVRTISWKFYGIPEDQVIGTTTAYVYRDSAGVNDLYRTTKIALFNDKQAKPVAIQTHIGKRPVLACGNEGGGGDIYMLRYSQGGKYPSLQLIVNHDDKDKEFFYQEKDNKSLDQAKKYSWNVVSIKSDWKEVFNK